MSFFHFAFMYSWSHFFILQFCASPLALVAIVSNIVLIWNCLCDSVEFAKCLPTRVTQLGAHTHFDSVSRDSCVQPRVMNLISVGVNYHDTIIKEYMDRMRIEWSREKKEPDETDEIARRKRIVSLFGIIIIFAHCCRFGVRFQLKMLEFMLVHGTRALHAHNKINHLSCFFFFANIFAIWRENQQS